MTKYVAPSGRIPKSEMSMMCGLPIGGRRASFLEETLGDLLVAREVPAEDLDGDLLVDELVFAPIDDAHAAFTERLLHEVPPVDGLADVRVGLDQPGAAPSTPRWREWSLL